MALKVTGIGTVIGKNNLGTSTSNFTVAVPAVKANSIVFANRLDSSNGLASGAIQAFGITAGTSFSVGLGTTAGTTESVSWELII